MVVVAGVDGLFRFIIAVIFKEPPAIGAGKALAGNNNALLVELNGLCDDNKFGQNCTSLQVSKFSDTGENRLQGRLSTAEFAHNRKSAYKLADNPPQRIITPLRSRQEILFTSRES